ncbi:MAG: GAF domain-containing protein [Bacteroidota bacterium]|nr:GAF domain-containing protein [Bacteroidota bacterium]MDP4233763.1 GAF domain-containing protein [Bacteroidota bacterium]MDP4242402.1 GAF domain-containing protein [Bacteroidota bacterium]MDP4287524.1 GAF domain-containing protein [Bacteroidota bacterium]
MISSDDRKPYRGSKVDGTSSTTPGVQGSTSNGRNSQPVKKIVFDDFQITRAEQQAQVDEERRVWREREERTQREKAPLFRRAVPRLKSLRDEMIGVQNKLPFFKRHRDSDSQLESETPPADTTFDPTPDYAIGHEPYFADHERAVVHITRASQPPPISEGPEHLRFAPEEQTTEWIDDSLPVEQIGIDEASTQMNSEYILDEVLPEAKSIPEPWQDDSIEEELRAEAILEDFVEVVEPADEAYPDESQIAAERPAEDPRTSDEPRIEPTMQVYLDSLRSFDSQPRRASDARDPRSDFVVILAEQLDILREQVAATSAMFFWVNSKRQHLVLESAALDDRAYQFLVSDKRFPIELDAVSRVATKRKPELHSVIAPQAERDLIPYYGEAIGISSFAGMPVFFGEGLVAVLTVDSATPEQFTPETLRILTSHSRLLSALIRSYIEKYDLLASARALDAARMLNQIVSPDQSARLLRERRNPDYVLRALTQAASEIIDWDWLASVSFDSARRTWSISSLQSKHGGAYVPPMTAISLEESLVGKCLAGGQSVRQDSLGLQSIRYNVEEDRPGAMGHAFLVIPIRTTNRNYGALAIEHSERAHYTDADVETLEHLSRSAAAALEIMALSEIVSERALTDLLTDLLNKHGLHMRTREELARATQFDEPLTLVLFEIDGASEFATRFSQEDSDTIVLSLARLLRFGARPFDVIARTDEHTLAALLIRMPDEDAYLWSEKMRKMIVSEVIAMGRRSFSVTVSAGVSGARRDGSVDELIAGAELALERARELGGNNVIVY